MASPSFRDRYGPWALVTGASSGMGEHFARELAARGFHLIITARRATLLETLASALRDEHGVEVVSVGLDLSEPDFLPALGHACAGRDVGLVVSNAGFGLKGEHHGLDPTRLGAMVHVNALAPMQLAHFFAPRLIARGRGGLLFTGSLESYMGFPWSSAYAASKAFVTVLGEGLWGELSPRGVDVLVISPGATDTEAPTLQGVDKSKIPSRMMSPAEVARQALAQLGKRPVYIPGFTNRWLIRMLSWMPRRIGLRLAGKGIRDTLVRA
jgi:short-subunit dehydrogenase